MGGCARSLAKVNSQVPVLSDWFIAYKPASGHAGTLRPGRIVSPQAVARTKVRGHNERGVAAFQSSLHAPRGGVANRSVGRKMSACAVSRSARADKALITPTINMYVATNHGWPSFCLSNAVAIIGVSPLAKIPENWYTNEIPL